MWLWILWFCPLVKTVYSISVCIHLVSFSIPVFVLISDSVIFTVKGQNSAVIYIIYIHMYPQLSAFKRCSSHKIYKLYTIHILLKLPGLASLSYVLMKSINYIKHIQAMPYFLLHKSTFIWLCMFFNYMDDSKSSKIIDIRLVWG